MILFASLAAALALQGGWTWTLYEGDGPLVLANEIPDTPQLRATVECERGSGLARINLYERAEQPGFATLTSGPASATGQTTDDTDHRSVPLRTDHPVFNQFVMTGALGIAFPGGQRVITLAPEHLGKLRRFAELCAG